MDANSNHGSVPPDLCVSVVQQKSRISTLLKLAVILGIVATVTAMLLPAVRTAREPARRSQCANNLRQIALALQLYEDVHGTLPPAFTTDADGKPLHSWRTLILPFLEEEQLYNSIDLSRPWNHPVNAAALNTKVSAYQCPSAERWESDGKRTIYQAVVTPNSCFRATEPRSLSEITDGAKNTLMLIEVDEEHAVPWMSPVDADEETVLGLGGPKSETAHPGGVHGAFVDGSVEFLRDAMPANARRALISIAGNDKLADEGAN
jgi:prepilin-type processing-associated H-X9-DG protein